MGECLQGSGFLVAADDLPRCLQVLHSAFVQLVKLVRDELPVPPGSIGLPSTVTISQYLEHPAVAGAIIGGRRPNQVDGVVGAADLKLGDDELDEIETFLKLSS